MVFFLMSIISMLIGFIITKHYVHFLRRDAGKRDEVSQMRPLNRAQETVYTICIIIELYMKDMW